MPNGSSASVGAIGVHGARRRSARALAAPVEWRGAVVWKLTTDADARDGRLTVCQCGSDIKSFDGPALAFTCVKVIPETGTTVVIDDLTDQVGVFLSRSRRGRNDQDAVLRVVPKTPDDVGASQERLADASITLDCPQAWPAFQKPGDVVLNLGRRR